MKTTIESLEHKQDIKTIFNLKEIEKMKQKADYVKSNNLWKKLLDFIPKKLLYFKEKDSIYKDVLVDMINEDILNDEDISYIEKNYETKKEYDYEI